MFHPAGAQLSQVCGVTLLYFVSLIHFCYEDIYFTVKHNYVFHFCLHVIFAIWWRKAVSQNKLVKLFKADVLYLLFNLFLGDFHPHHFTGNALIKVAEGFYAEQSSKQCLHNLSATISKFYHSFLLIRNGKICYKEGTNGSFQHIYVWLSTISLATFLFGSFFSARPLSCQFLKTCSGFSSLAYLHSL